MQHTPTQPTPPANPTPPQPTQPTGMEDASPRADSAAAAASGGRGWAWAEALPEWVRAKGWTARSYRYVRCICISTCESIDPVDLAGVLIDRIHRPSTGSQERPPRGQLLPLLALRRPTGILGTDHGCPSGREGRWGGGGCRGVGGGSGRVEPGPWWWGPRGEFVGGCVRVVVGWWWVVGCWVVSDVTSHV